MRSRRKMTMGQRIREMRKHMRDKGKDQLRFLATKNMEENGIRVRVTKNAEDKGDQPRSEGKTIPCTFL